MASIVKHGDRWRAFVATPSGKRRSKVFTKKADASRWARDLEHAIDQGSYNPASAQKMTLGQAADRWLTGQVWRPTTTELNTSIVRKWILPTFGHRQLRSLAWSEIRDWVSEMSRTLAPSSVEARYRTLVAILNQAVADQIILRNPATIKKIQLPKSAVGNSGSFSILSVDQVSALVSALPGPLKCFALVGVGAGLRPGEIAGLRPSDITLIEDGGSINVVQQVVTTSKHGATIGPLKTAASTRTVPVPNELTNALRFHLESNPAQTWNGIELVFSNRYGAPWRRNTLGDAWRKASKTAGIGSGARGWHSLRHFYASSLIAAGEPVSAVQARMGHSSPVETLNTYTHLWPDSEVGTRSAVSASLSSIGLAVADDKDG